MRLTYLLRALVAAICVTAGCGTMMNKCLKVLANMKIRTPCSSLKSSHIRPCLVETQQDADSLIEAEVIGGGTPIPINHICAARKKMMDADCISVDVQPDQQQNWHWTGWRNSSGMSIRNIAITEGSTSFTCPYEERYTEPVHADCLEAYNLGEHESRVYTISPDWVTLMRVHCEQDIDGGGWTVFQRRLNGVVDFARTWEDYKVGFGDPEGEYWIGNDNLHLLTKKQDQKVKFDLAIADGQTAYADYSEFWVANETESYLLHVGQHSGTAGNSMVYHDGATFSTRDWGVSRHCAHTAGWWYKNCFNVNLNGDYHAESFGVVWLRWKGFYVPLTYAACMLKTQD